MPQILRTYVRMMSEHEVATASDPIEARRLIAAGFTPDIIFSDWEMPRMNGGEFCEVLRLEGNSTPFYVISGQLRDHAAVGATGSLLKPFAQEELEKILELHLR